jgi:hypothetical protein
VAHCSANCGNRPSIFGHRGLILKGDPAHGVTALLEIPNERRELIGA